MVDALRVLACVIEHGRGACRVDACAGPVARAAYGRALREFAAWLLRLNTARNPVRLGAGVWLVDVNGICDRLEDVAVWCDRLEATPPGPIIEAATELVIMADVRLGSPEWEALVADALRFAQRDTLE